MKLYNADLSPYAARVRMAAYAKGIDLATELPPEGMKSPSYLALNPMGKVPTLVLDDGTALPESQVICEYLEDRFPTPSLRGADPETAAQARLLARIVDIYLAASQAPLYAQLRAAERDPAVIAKALADEQAAYRHIEHFMAADGPYLAGPALTLADCALVPFLFLTMALARPLRRDDPLAGLDRLAAYWRTVNADPHAQKVMGEIKAALEALRQAAKAAG